MKDILDAIKKGIIKERKNKNYLFFWLPFILMLTLSIVLFIIYKVSIIGWLLSIVVFISLFIFRIKILLLNYIFQVITIFIVILAVITMVITTKASTSSNNNEKSKTPLKEITLNKTYSLPQNKGTYEIIVLTDKKENRYELGLNIKALTSIVPNDFVYDDFKAKSYMRENITVYELDQIEAFITSTDSKTKYYSHGPISLKLDYSSGSAQLLEMFPSTFKFYFNSEEKLKSFINKYNKLEVYRYNIGEVGINDFKSERQSDGSYYGSYGYNAEKAYKLHPILLETKISWDDLKSEIELK